MSRIVTFGEIMLRLATPGHRRFIQAMPGTLEATFAGAEASVAASLAYLGADAAFVSALPAHPIADACLADLRRIGVDTRHVLRPADGRLGIYFLETGANQRPGNVVYDREGAAVAVTPAEAYDWEAVFAGAEWFLISGITPALSRNAAAVARAAVEAAVRCGVHVACDMNYRSKLWRWEPGLAPRALAARTMQELMPAVNLFIGGLEDAAEMLGVRAREGAADSCLDVARQLVARYPSLGRVAMTLREGISASHNNLGGFLYQADLDQAFRAPLQDGRPSAYAITDMVDRLGGGDAFTAGLLFALTRPGLAEPAQAVAFATAAACLAHSVEGDFNYSTREEIEALMAGSASGRVNR